MRRWNGWGDEATHYPLPDSAARYLEAQLGPGTPFEDARLKQVITMVPESPLAPQALITTAADERLLHARGQSLPDWIALRSGRLGTFPAGVAYPGSDADLQTLFQYARRYQVCLIPYGGGTSVVGHINPRSIDAPTLTVDLSRLNHLVELDPLSQLATFEAGVCGPDLERQLQQHGCTLGHFPQSFELSTLGGWIVTRSSGQQSYHYGRIEDLFAGGHVETPVGPLELRPLPASAAGPDLRQLIMGSEGRFGVVTRAIVRVQKLPQAEDFHAVFFHDWQSGAQAVREIAQSHVPVSMLRLSDAQETETTLALSGREQLVDWANRGLNLLNYKASRCLLIFGVTGTRTAVANAHAAATAIARRHGGLAVGTAIGHQWRKSRFLAPYLRNILWERGYAIDTLETALPWPNVVPTALALKTVIHQGLQAIDERVLVFAHLSHVYPDGASIYVTYLWRRAADPDEMLQRWQTLKSAVSRLIVENGGTISHQHGVGLDHAPYLKAEKGELGLNLIEAVRQTLDPDRLLNPGKLID